ncbi:MAG: carboxysome shell carbonic anhydrase [Chromatiales bacterium]|nr:carboxysome shell carbonic anhydrase [Chromatiales bacterium]
MTPCADGPPRAAWCATSCGCRRRWCASRKAFAGAMFDVEAERAQLGRDRSCAVIREGVPNPASDAGTRYLKIGGVSHQQLAIRATRAAPRTAATSARPASAVARARCNGFAKAIENSHLLRRQRVATLLIGVDTDTDAITRACAGCPRRAELCDRYMDNAQLYRVHPGMPPVSGAARGQRGDPPGEHAASGRCRRRGRAATSEGMRWFCGSSLLKNNMAQIEYVRAYHGGRYADISATPSASSSVGDSFEDVQMRNRRLQRADGHRRGRRRRYGRRHQDFHEGEHVSRGLPVPVFGPLPLRRPGAGRAGARGVDAPAPGRRASGRVTAESVIGGCALSLCDGQRPVPAQSALEDIGRGGPKQATVRLRMQSSEVSTMKIMSG